MAYANELMAILRTGLFLLITLPIFAQAQLTVKQLTSFIDSSLKLKHDDRQIAEYLKRVKLSERLDDRTIEDLQGKGAGRLTVSALKVLGEASKDLATAAVAPKAPPPVVLPPPSAEEQTEIIEAARQYALNYTSRLPDFICTQVTRRFHDPSGLEIYRAVDLITERLSYFDHHEDYKVVLINNQPAGDMKHDQLGWATSTGEFGSLMNGVFEPASQASFRWERWTTWRGRRSHVFSYFVAQERSQWRVSYQNTESIVPAYKGLIYIDAASPAVMRITLEAVQIPSTFPIQVVTTALDYDRIKISDVEHVLPLRAEVRMREGKNLLKNEVEFHMYRKFGAEATIKFETPDPLPVEKEAPAGKPRVP